MSPTRKIPPQAGLDVGAGVGVVVVGGEDVGAEDRVVAAGEIAVVDGQLREDLAGVQVAAVGVGEALLADGEGEGVVLELQADAGADDLEVAQVVALGGVGEDADERVGQPAEVEFQQRVDLHVDGVLVRLRLDDLDAAKNVVGDVAAGDGKRQRAVVVAQSGLVDLRRGVDGLRRVGRLEQQVRHDGRDRRRPGGGRVGGEAPRGRGGDAKGAEEQKAALAHRPKRTATAPDGQPAGPARPRVAARKSRTSRVCGIRLSAFVELRKRPYRPAPAPGTTVLPAPPERTLPPPPLTVLPSGLGVFGTTVPPPVLTRPPYRVLP